MNEDKEIAAMIAIADTLNKFDNNDKAVVSRILKWTISRYGEGDIDGYEGVEKKQSGDGLDSEIPRVDDFADLYDATNPKTEPERALVAGYWLTFGENKPEFTSQEANNYLKNLGYRVSNITDALSSLNSKIPTLVMQTAKSGKSRQARKKYKLTTAGHDFVKKMISGQNVSSKTLGLNQDVRISKKHPKKPNRSAKKSPTVSAESKKKPGVLNPSIVKDLDLSGGSKYERLREFYEQYETKSNLQRNLIFVYYLEQRLGILGISVDHIFTCYRDIPKLKIPQDLRQSLFETKSRKGWLDTSDTEKITVTMLGINYLEHDMPKKLKQE